MSADPAQSDDGGGREVCAARDGLDPARRRATRAASARADTPDGTADDLRLELARIERTLAEGVRRMAALVCASRPGAPLGPGRRRPRPSPGAPGATEPECRPRPDATDPGADRP